MAQSVLEKIQPLTQVQSEPSSSLSLQRENEIEKETAELTEGLHTLLFCGHDNLFMLYVLPALSLPPSLSVFQYSWGSHGKSHHDVIILYTPKPVRTCLPHTLCSHFCIWVKNKYPYQANAATLAQAEDLFICPVTDRGRVWYTQNTLYDQFWQFHLMALVKGDHINYFTQL